ncbi:unnamed protein product [Ectocarpus sp. 8 AP-2014]
MARWERQAPVKRATGPLARMEYTTMASLSHLAPSPFIEKSSRSDCRRSRTSGRVSRRRQYVQICTKRRVVVLLKPGGGSMTTARRPCAMSLFDPLQTITSNLCPMRQVLRRLGQNEAVYTGFEGIDVPGMSRIILSYLHSYQEGARFRRADFVHGDPVFSNCLQNKEGDVAFVDMRGALGDLLCTEGDTNYDLAKVYQSLCGYDFIIMDKDVDPNAVEMLRDLEQNVFWPFVRENYAGTKPEDIAMLAASHFLSMVPLHENRGHQARFMRACNDIVKKWSS